MCVGKGTRVDFSILSQTSLGRAHGMGSYSYVLYLYGSCIFFFCIICEVIKIGVSCKWRWWWGGGDISVSLLMHDRRGGELETVEVVKCSRLMRKMSYHPGFIMPFNQYCFLTAGFFFELINPLNAELNPICHLLILLGDLTFMGTCIVSIFQNISNKM